MAANVRNFNEQYAEDGNDDEDFYEFVQQDVDHAQENIENQDVDSDLEDIPIANILPVGQVFERSYDHDRLMEFQRDIGPTANMEEALHIEFLELFFINDNFLSHLCRETNRYYAQQIAAGPELPPFLRARK